MEKNIVLIGMPGSGKTTVGKILAKRLGLTLIDLDQEIVKAEGKSIPEIFKENGETYFREAETRALEAACRETGRIIATGGGIVTVERNFEPLHRNSIVFFLDRETGKLKTKGRPLSETVGVQKLYEARYPLYTAWMTPGCRIRCPDSPGRTAGILADRLRKMEEI